MHHRGFGLSNRGPKPKSLKEMGFDKNQISGPIAHDLLLAIALDAPNLVELGLKLRIARGEIVTEHTHDMTTEETAQADYHAAMLTAATTLSVNWPEWEGSTRFQAAKDLRHAAFGSPRTQDDSAAASDHGDRRLKRLMDRKVADAEKEAHALAEAEARSESEENEYDDDDGEWE